MIVARAGRSERIRTSDIQLPKLALYQAELRSDILQTAEFLDFLCGMLKSNVELHREGNLYVA